MKKNELIKELQKIPGNPEVLMREEACENVHEVDIVYTGWYVDDGEDAAYVVDGTEDPEDYHIPKDQQQVIVVA